MWKEVNMITKEMLQPWQDSNLQSPDPKSGALSIRPHGSLCLMYFNTILSLPKCNTCCNDLSNKDFQVIYERKVLHCCFNSSNWKSSYLRLQCFHFLPQSSNNHVSQTFDPCTWVLCIIPGKTDSSSEILFLHAFSPTETCTSTFRLTY